MNRRDIFKTLLLAPAAPPLIAATKAVHCPPREDYLAPIPGWYMQTPRGPLDGVNREFLLDYPVLTNKDGVGMHVLQLNSVLQYNGRDYVVRGRVLTYLVAPKHTDLQWISILRHGTAGF